MTLDATHPEGCEPRQIYADHLDKVVKYLVWKCRNREDAKEIAAISFTRFFAAWPAEGLDPDHAVRRLMTIVSNEWKNWVRNRVRHPERLVDWTAVDLDIDASDAFHVASELMSRGDVSGVIQRVDAVRALRFLPPRQQEAVVLRHVVGYTQAETATIMRISPETVKSHLDSAMKTLRSSSVLDGYQVEQTNQAEVGR